ncbi:MAG: DUF4893 domain-containing protein [Allosphingosinicella sp.]
MRALVLLPLLAAALAGCAAKPARPAAAEASSTMSWRSLATPDDRKRLRDWRTAWVAALAKAKASNPNDVAAEGDLLEPDAAPLDEVAPPPGDYRCRVVKLGSQEAGMPDFVAYPAFTCRIGPGAGAAAAAAAPSGPGDAGAIDFVKAEGSQRPVGRLFPDTRRRMAFLGTLQLGDERGTLRYGHDQARDMAGLLQRIGARRWRLVLPYPHFESTLDLVELVPAG